MRMSLSALKHHLRTSIHQATLGKELTRMREVHAILHDYTEKLAARIAQRIAEKEKRTGVSEGEQEGPLEGEGAERALRKETSEAGKGTHAQTC